MQRHIKKLGIVLRPETSLENFLPIYQIFQKVNIQIFLENSCAKEINLIPSYSLNELIGKIDAIASIGGDGTLLSLIRKVYGTSIPVFGINTGKLGFLTATNPFELQDFLKLLTTGNYLIEEHMMLEAQINNQKFFAINEFLISKNNLTNGILNIQAYIDNEIFNTYRGDSLIVATPTGSTAYNISAGGSIIYPLCKNILLTPVAAHTLTQRPVVLDHTPILHFKVNTQSIMIVDGQESIVINPSDIITIKSAKKPALLIQQKQRNYFKVLKEKFQWGQND